MRYYRFVLSLFCLTITTLAMAYDPVPADAAGTLSPVNVTVTAGDTTGVTVDVPVKVLYIRKGPDGSWGATESYFSYTSVELNAGAAASHKISLTPAMTSGVYPIVPYNAAMGNNYGYINGFYGGTTYSDDFGGTRLFDSLRNGGVYGNLFTFQVKITADSTCTTGLHSFSVYPQVNGITKRGNLDIFDASYLSAPWTTVNVTVKAPQTVTITPTSKTVTVGDSINFTADGGHNGYKWKVTPPGSSSATLEKTASPTDPTDFSRLFDSAGTYTVAVFSPGSITYAVSDPPATATITVNPAAPKAVISANNSTDPITIDPGDQLLIRWTTNNATSAIVKDQDGKTIGNVLQSSLLSPAYYSVSSLTLTAGATYTYTITATGAGGTTDTKSVQVKVNSAPKAVISANNSTDPITIDPGVQLLIRWSTTNATSAIVKDQDGKTIGNVLQSSILSPAYYSVSSLTLTAGATYTYTITATGAGGTTDTKSVQVKVNPAPTAVISANNSTVPITIDPGDPLTIRWATSNATSVAVTDQTGHKLKDQNGNIIGNLLQSSLIPSVIPSDPPYYSEGNLTAGATYTYTLTATGAGGTTATKSVQVTVSSAPTAVISANGSTVPITIDPGDHLLIRWATSNATSVAVTDQTGHKLKDQNGNIIGNLPQSADIPSVIPSDPPYYSEGNLTAGATYTYTLTATGAGGTATKSVQVTVNAATLSAQNVTISAQNVPVGTAGAIWFSPSVKKTATLNVAP